MVTTIRPARTTDAAECGRIIYAAFTDIADRHGFSRPFPSPEVATGLATMRVRNRRHHVGSEIHDRDTETLGTSRFTRPHHQT